MKQLTTPIIPAIPAIHQLLSDQANLQIQQDAIQAQQLRQEHHLNTIVSSQHMQITEVELKTKTSKATIAEYSSN
jgi:hypothetical protein